MYLSVIGRKANNKGQRIRGKLKTEQDHPKWTPAA